MKFIESHTVKYSEGNPKREYALVKAFDYMVEHINNFTFTQREGNSKFKSKYNVTEKDEVLFLQTLIYNDKTFTDKDVLLDENLDIHEKYIDGNELYVFIINNVHIKDYDGLIYLKFSLHDEIISFHDTKYPLIKKDYNYVKECRIKKFN